MANKQPKRSAVTLVKKLENVAELERTHGVHGVSFGMKHSRQDRIVTTAGSVDHVARVIAKGGAFFAKHTKRSLGDLASKP